MAEFHGRSLEHPMLGKHSAGLQDLNMSFQASLLEKTFYLETSPVSPAWVWWDIDGVSGLSHLLCW